MDSVEHNEECSWKLRGIVKTLKWWEFMGLKNCPECNAGVK